MDSLVGLSSWTALESGRRSRSRGRGQGRYDAENHEKLLLRTSVVRRVSAGMIQESVRSLLIASGNLSPKKADQKKDSGELVLELQDSVGVAHWNLYASTVSKDRLASALSSPLRMIRGKRWTCRFLQDK